MTWILIISFSLFSAVLGTPPGPPDNFYSYRMDYDDDLEYNNGYQPDTKHTKDYYDEDDSYGWKKSDDWSSGSNRGWGIPPKSLTFNVNHIPPSRHRPLTPQKPSSSGWGEEESAWVPPSRRRKPSYVVKIRRPVKKDPAWIYFRPPNPVRVGSGWPRPTGQGQHPIPPPIRHPPSNKVASSWEEETNSGSYPKEYPKEYPKDASYSFAYDAGDHDRSEYSDPWGTVSGSYSYVDPTGVRRTVHYTAGAATGFKILNSSPSNVVEKVFRDPVIVRRKPSAFVYHLHPDGGWKPWEGRKEKIKTKSRNLEHNEEPEEELSLDETRFNTHSESQKFNQNYQIYENQEHKKSDNHDTTTHHHQHIHYEPPEQRKIEFENYKNNYGDKNPLIGVENKIHEEEKNSYDHHDIPRLTNHHHHPYEPQEQRNVEVRGYKGGYGDRNPLVVVEDKPISASKMMSLRMRRRKPERRSEGQQQSQNHQQKKLSNSNNTN